MYKGKKLVAKGQHQGLTEHTNIAPWGFLLVNITWKKQQDCQNCDKTDMTKTEKVDCTTIIALSLTLLGLLKTLNKFTIKTIKLCNWNRMINLHHQYKGNVYEAEYLQSVEVTELWVSSPILAIKRQNYENKHVAQMNT